MMATIEFANKVAQLCFEKYKNLKFISKLRSNEFTVLSGIVLRKPSGQLYIVSLATGTKCLGGSELQDFTEWKPGSRLSDSHAEILARRAFFRYLYYQVDLVQNNLQSDIFRLTEDKNITLIENSTFHFFSSQSPCGDCSIIPKITKKLNDFENRPSKLLKLNNDCEDTTVNLTKFEDKGIEILDVHRTGAKCLTTEKTQDTHESGSKYHVLGPLRTKPGRGDRTLSLSCSDKMAKWIIVGVQGSLLSLLIPTIRFETIVIAGGCPFSLESMERGLYKRFNYTIDVPTIVQADISFAHNKSYSRTQPCPTSMIWCDVPGRGLEFSVEGRKQGATKKNKGNYLLISRRSILKMFLRVFEKSIMSDKFTTHPKKLTYYHLKQSSQQYQELWTKYRTSIFQTCPLKPQHLQNFVL